MRILVNGICGHMGQEVAKLCLAGYRNAELAAGVDPGCAEGCLPSNMAEIPCSAGFDGVAADVDCIVDFSHHSGTLPLLAFATGKKIPVVIATTGQTPEEREAITQAANEIPVFFAANFSLGIALLIELAKKTAAVLPDAEIEIIEKHHDRKVDAPSGTALAIAKAIQQVRPEATIVTGRNGMGKRTKQEIGIHAIRMGNIAGEHEVIVGTQNQTITLKHEVHNRALFAEGALAAAEFVRDKPVGLYDMNSLIQF